MVTGLTDPHLFNNCNRALPVCECFKKGLCRKGSISVGPVYAADHRVYDDWQSCPVADRITHSVIF